METVKLYMVLLGCRPDNRLTEQHDVFFGAGNSLKDLVKDIYKSWPDGKKDLHIDAWREVNTVGNYKITISPKESNINSNSSLKLFFINLGGYRPNEFEEDHYKMLIIAENSAKAIAKAKKSVFYKTNGYKGAPTHIDEKYALDADEVYELKDILPGSFKEQYDLLISEEMGLVADKINQGYLLLRKIK